MVATLLKIKPAALDVQLVTVKAHNNIVLQQKGKLLNPHITIWNNKRICTTPVPVAFNIGNDHKPKLEIQLAVGGKVGQGVLEVLAANGTLLFTGNFNGTDTVYVTACFLPEALAQLKDDVLYLQLVPDNGNIVALGTIPVEMYWVNLGELPEAMHRNGTPVELLNRLCDAVTLASYFPAEAAYMYPVQSIVQSIFNYGPPRLDVYSGTPRFVTVNSWNSITLHYNAFRAAHNNAGAIASSFDMAAVLQYLLQCYGYRVYFCHMQPFGYLSLTNLAGRGLCNNPLFGKNGSQVISPSANGRTVWSSHSFVFLPAYGVAADASAGPHMGYEMMGDYISQMVDQAYHKQKGLPEAKEHTVTQYSGVNSIDSISSIRTLPDFIHSAAFIKENSFSYKSFCALATKAIAGKWPEPDVIPYLRGAWDVFYSEVVPGTEEVLKIWMLKRGEEIITIRLYVVSGENELAYNRFIAQASLSQSETMPLKADAPGMGHFSAASVVPGDNRYVWIYHNAVLDISSSDNSMDLTVIAAWYFAWASNNLVTDVLPCLPLTNLTCQGTGDLPGGQFIVTLNASENTLLHFLQSGSGARLVNRDAHYLEFEIQQAVMSRIKVLVVSNDTLLVNTETVLPAQL